MALSVSIVTDHGGHRVLVSNNGTHVETPPVENLAFYAGLGVLVMVGVVEWPVAAALTVGHILIDVTGRPGLQSLGSALEEV